MANVRREGETFNEYVKPDTDFEWDEACTNIHGLHPLHPNIVAAANITDVWGRFSQWLDRHIKKDELVILVAWNGEKCDLKWLWKLTQAPRSTLNLPLQIEYFIDPYRVISNYTSCRLNPKKSKLEALKLGVVWKHIMGRKLNRAHDSLVDVKAQIDVVLSDAFVPFLNRRQSVSIRLHRREKR